MSKTRRYLLLVIVITIFIILAPLIVLYVSGKNIDSSGESKSTGILDAQSSPRGADVFLNGEKKDSTPATIRFISEGEYFIEIKKPGFRSWSKNLFIEANKVTYAGSLNELVTLLPDQPAKLISDQSVDSFAIIKNYLFFISNKNKFISFNLDQNKITQVTNLPIQVSALSEVNNDDYLSARTNNGNRVLVQLSSGKIIQLAGDLATAEQLQITENKDIFGLKNGQLLVSKIGSTTSKKIASDIVAITHDSGLLYIASSSDPNYLSTQSWDGQTLSLQTSLLQTKLPDAKNYQIYLSNQKELFLLADQSFFRVNSQLDLINNQVAWVNFDKPHQLLTFQTAGEIYYYNFFSSKAELLSRVDNPGDYSLVVPNLGYGFVSQKNGLKAIEIDNRNGQNHYQLFDPQTKKLSKLLLSPKQNKLIFQIDLSLYQLEITE